MFRVKVLAFLRYTSVPPFLRVAPCLSVIVRNLRECTRVPTPVPLPLPMDCSGFRARHLEYLDNTLDERTLVACERHRSECAACAALDIRVRRSLLLCHNVPDPLPTCDLTARVLAGVRADRQRQAVQREQRSRVAMWASACAVCALMALPWAAARRSSEPRMVPLAQSSEPVAPQADTPAPFEPLPFEPLPEARSAFRPVARGPLDSVPRPYATPVSGIRDANLLLLTTVAP